MYEVMFQTQTSKQKSRYDFTVSLNGYKKKQRGGPGGEEENANKTLVTPTDAENKRVYSIG